MLQRQEKRKHLFWYGFLHGSQLSVVATNLFKDKRVGFPWNPAKSAPPIRAQQRKQSAESCRGGLAYTSRPAGGLTALSTLFSYFFPVHLCWLTSNLACRSLVGDRLQACPVSEFVVMSENNGHRDWVASHTWMKSRVLRLSCVCKVSTQNSLLDLLNCIFILQILFLQI